MNIRLSKIQVAEKMLHMAIKLFFDGADVVSIHLLVSAASEVLTGVAKSKNIASWCDDINYLIKDEHKKEVRGILKRRYNFLKHADKDPNGTIEFSEEGNDMLLMITCDDFKRVTGSVTPLMVYLMTYIAGHYPKLFEDKAKDELFNTDVYLLKKEDYRELIGTFCLEE